MAYEQCVFNFDSLNLAADLLIACSGLVGSMHNVSGIVTYLKVSALFADFLEALLDALKAGRRCCRIDQHEGVRRRNGEASHGGELHVTGCVQNVHLRHKGLKQVIKLENQLVPVNVIINKYLYI